MRAEIVDRSIHSPAPHGEVEDASAQSSQRSQGSTSALVAMMACNVVLLLMLSA